LDVEPQTVATDRGLENPVMTDAPRDRCWLELVVALGVSAAFAATCLGIKIDASERVGQVSLLAAVELRFLLFAIPTVLCMAVAAKARGGAHFELASRLGCAAIAGLASATIAGGILAILHGAQYGLGAKIGDSNVLAIWADTVRHGGTAPELYPPFEIHLIAWISDLLGITTAYAIKPFQILGLLLVGPVSYASWRLLLRPGWALAISVVATLPLIDPFRPYPFFVLVVFVPLAVRLLEILRGAADASKLELLRAGIGLGLGLGVLCLVYSGWFMWSAPGFLVAAAYVFPWRRGSRNGVFFCTVAAIAFFAVTARYVIGVLHAPPIKDGFIYFDSRAEPMYIAMWRGDLPGIFEKLGLWPPAGELAGVGVFTLVLVAGLGVAIMLGRGRTVVLGVISMMLGAWVLRLWYAEHMWKTGLVQLYPRTTAELLYCSLILCGFAVFFAVERHSRLRTPSAVIGGSCAVLLLSGFAASATLDRFMPKLDCRDYGYLAWRALKTPKENAINRSLGASVEASSSLETSGFSKDSVVDGKIETGYSSELSAAEDREEWIEVRFGAPTTFSRVVLEAWGDGFPVDFTIEVWNGSEWQTRLSQRGYRAFWGPEVFSWNRTETTERIRIRATRLAPVEPAGSISRGFALRLREIEVFK
jgi:galactan 5-O-arabinofuranosyltransferase